MSDAHSTDDEIPPAQAALIDELMRVSARWLLADADPHHFINRLAQEGPRHFAALLGDAPDGAAGERTVHQAQFFRSFGWAIASAMPLPGHGFAARKLALPGRNEPCICGSLRKFKHCCAVVFEHLPAFEPEGLGAIMLTEMPRAQWATLPATRVPPCMVLDAAALLHEAGELRAVCSLLEPWSKLAAPWPAARAPLLDLLCDVYLDLGQPRKREKLARAMVERGDGAVQSTGWRRLSMMAADAGDTVAAQQAFERAQRLTPDEPDVALLEVTTLLGAGETARAAERATFHARRLARQPQAAAQADAIEMLERLGRGEFPPLPGMADGDDAFDDAGFVAAGDIVGVLDPDSPFHELQRWAESLPAPKLRLLLDGATPADLGALTPAAVLAAPLASWRKAFRLTPPSSAWGSLGPEALEVFANERWSALLQRDPRLADSFEVLDGLVLVLDLVPLGLAAGLQALLLGRALELWSLLLARYPQARCEWAHLANRPALRLLAYRVEIDTSPRAEASMNWLQALVEVLNPQDNHGLRERLAAVYLRRGEVAAALTLCERYPEVRVGMQLLHARALLASQRLDDAGAMLKQALQSNRYAAALLVARRAAKRAAVSGRMPGSIEEAQVAVHNQHDLWRDPAVRKWLRGQIQPAAERGLFDSVDP